MNNNSCDESIINHKVKGGGERGGGGGGKKIFNYCYQPFSIVYYFPLTKATFLYIIYWKFRIYF